MVKSRSVDVAKDPEEVFDLEERQLAEWGLDVVDRVRLQPYDKDHLAVMLRMSRPPE